MIDSAEYVVFPIAYFSALFVGWSLRSFIDKEIELDLSVRNAFLNSHLGAVKAELEHTKAVVESLKLKLSRIRNVIDLSDDNAPENDSSDDKEPEDDSSDDEMPELVSVGE